MNVSDDQRSELDDLSNRQQQTRRQTVFDLEAILFQPIPVLDHGFIRVVDYMGDDSSVVQAARVSYGAGTKKTSEDRTLIRYLMRHHHTTPFEMAEIKLHVKLPIFVARQWIRHRTASVNEYSARYSILDREFYLPEPSQLAAQAVSNRQGRGQVLEGAEASRVLHILRADAETAYEHYLEMLNESEPGRVDNGDRQGLARELARMNLSLNYYTQWYWKIDLHNYMNFLRLRADAHAQYEIRVYADVMLDVMRRWVPLVHESFQEYVVNAISLSATAVSIIRRALTGEKITYESSGLPRREWDELAHSLGL